MVDYGTCFKTLAAFAVITNFFLLFLLLKSSDEKVSYRRMLSKETHNNMSSEAPNNNVSSEALPSNKISEAPPSKKISEAPRYIMISDDTERNDSNVYLLFWSAMFHYGSWGMNPPTSSESDLKGVNCSFTNCIFTSNRTLLSHVHNFDAIFTHVWREYVKMNLPKTRSPHQFYIHGSNE
jgi:hypothetical protein